MPEQPTGAIGPGVLGGLRRRLGRTPAIDDALVDVDVARQLVARCDQVARDLGRSGLQTRRLTGLGYAQLAHRCWAPEQARAQRFQGEIADYTALVVGAEQPHWNRRTSPLNPPAATADPLAAACRATSVCWRWVGAAWQIWWRRARSRCARTTSSWTGSTPACSP